MTPNMRRTILAIAGGAALLLIPQVASAQPPRTPYVPRPTLSPWLNLNRQDPGPVGPYLSYVRPEQRLRSTLLEQQTRLNTQAAELKSLREQSTTFQARGSMAPTGVGATFMNYSHYYSLRGR